VRAHMSAYMHVGLHVSVLCCQHSSLTMRMVILRVCVSSGRFCGDWIVSVCVHMASVLASERSCALYKRARTCVRLPCVRACKLANPRRMLMFMLLCGSGYVAWHQHVGSYHALMCELV
jgi:hypothetical protein